MSKVAPSVFTIAPGSGFLRVLAQKILEGFPLDAKQEKPSLSDWTILLPTRRSARELSSILAEECGHKALLLPRIKPIGDLDEDRLLGDDESGDLPKAISRTGQLFTLLGLLEEWARENPHIALAQEIRSSHVQSLGLATSLLKLLDQIETEETDFTKIDEAYDADLSEHRNSILSLIGLLKVALPQRLAQENLMGPSERRSRLIRMEAKRISEGTVKGPIIAAGSTGTIPATRALLKAISFHSKGAVILPGLDLLMDSEAWMAVTPEHPQFALKTLVGELGIERGEVNSLDTGHKNRNWLTSELTRPAATAEKWHVALKDHHAEMTNALTDVKLVEAPDRHSEARCIALILRESLETPKRTAALITPDRDLAKRVKAELLRWNIVIDDSAGEPLTQFGLASLTASLLDAVASDFAPASLISLLSHKDCDLGMGRENLLLRLRQLEIVVLRGYGTNRGIDGLRLAYERAQEGRSKKLRTHALVAGLQDEDWEGLHRLVLLIAAALTPLAVIAKAPLSTHLSVLNTCLQTLAPSADLTLPENRTFAEIMYELQSEANRHPIDNFAAASAVVIHSLRSEPHRQARGAHPRLAIYGVLEARLLPVDVAVLGGLNEGKWPSQPDPGPWLNRTMRTIFGMQQPERDIGVSAHDFTQGLGHAYIYLTWSKRIEGSPQIPSRWILRLQTVMQAGGIDLKSVHDLRWTSLAKKMDEPISVVPLGKPKPTPPIMARPTHYSVSAVENLIRDPYAIYASKTLCLDPLPLLDQAADAPLRGNLFHEAIKEWNLQQPKLLSENSLEILLEAGRKVFEPLNGDPEIASFWWPRFKRMAAWLVAQEIELRANTTRVYPETEGKVEFDIGGVAHSLSARADRIDVLQNGQARIVDYKTGAPPSKKQVISGMKPQLPLEAAILALHGFEKLTAMKTDELIFLKISGASDEGELNEIKPEKDQNLTDIGLSHFNWLKKLLHEYRIESQPYYPRANIFKEEEASDYDHLSRYAEWMLAGES